MRFQQTQDFNHDTPSLSSALGHGGDVRRLAEARGVSALTLIDFSSSMNPLGPPAWIREVLYREIETVSMYPDPACTGFIHAVSARFDVPKEMLIPCNGTSELIFALPRILKKQRAIIPSPTYTDYAQAAALAGLETHTPIGREENDFQIDFADLDSRVTSDDIVFLGRPCNPTGSLCNPEEISRLARRHPDAVFIVDEAYIDFIEGGEDFSLRKKRPDNVMVLYSMTKTFAVAALRLGVGFALPSIALRVRKALGPWNVNASAQAVGQRALFDADYLARTVQVTARQRTRTIAALKEISSLRVYPSAANFLLVRSERRDLDAPLIAERLLADGIVIRVCDNFTGLDRRYFRLAVKTEDQTERLLRSIRTLMRS